jgi:hypothetical protein
LSEQKRSVQQISLPHHFLVAIPTARSLTRLIANHQIQAPKRICMPTTAFLKKSESDHLAQVSMLRRGLIARSADGFCKRWTKRSLLLVGYPATGFAGTRAVDDIQEEAFNTATPRQRKARRSLELKVGAQVILSCNG